MEKNDLVYKVLKMILEGKEPSWNDLNLTKEEFGELVEEIRDAILVENVSVDRGGQGNKVVLVHLKHAILTEKGNKFIELFEQK